MIHLVKEKLEMALEDWEMMKKASEDESEECAERFERHFYEFIDKLKIWYQGLDQPPATIEEAEDFVEIKKIIDRLPAPLELNFLNELELIIDGKEEERYD